MRRNPQGNAIAAQDHIATPPDATGSLLSGARPRSLELLGAAALATLAALAIGAYWLSEPDELTDGRCAQTAAPVPAPAPESLRRKRDSAFAAGWTDPRVPMLMIPGSALASRLQRPGGCA